ncbi:MAG: SO_0444 family Cu/Zn efflux transporter, partial [Candidatus Cloacimonetes bacterium]|nr:SO_0444 family Cu/Zn efflux transporter [Candidatus Cloacimonadota bacterium]
MLELFNTIFSLLLEMAPYLLLGFFIAGFLHILIPSDKIYHHLSGNSLSSIIKAAIFGVPLPICSCGVIPVSAYIRKEGAGKGATVSFLSSTPTSGVDSVLATYSLMGPVYAIIRPIAAFFSGILSGSITALLDKKTNGEKIKNKPTPANNCVECSSAVNRNENIFSKVKSALAYGFDELLEDTGKLLLIGVVIGGLISFLVPEGFIQSYLGNPWLAYPFMLLISIPMYICATGSIPIAASLIMEGMAPGAALIFLIAGPATNTTTIAFITGKLGKKYTFAYIGSIIITAILFGLLLDLSWSYFG